MNNNNNARSLVLLTVLGAVVIIAAAWFLLISPVMSSASEANEAATEQESQNENTQIQVNKLKAQYANIEEYEAQLAGLQEQIPTDPGYADLQRLFAKVAEKHDVVITSLEFGSAAELETATNASQPATDDSAVTTDPQVSASPAPTEDDGSQAAASGLYGIPVSVTVTGQYDDVMDTLKELQTMDGRLVLITTVALTSATARDEAESTTGADTNGVFSGQVFVLTSSTPTETQPDGSGSETSPSPSPAP